MKNFAIDAGKKVLEFILEGVLKLAGPLGAQVMALLKKGGDIFNKIVEDPVGFLGNLLKAVKGGFEGFMGNILEHLKNGLLGWLFGALAGAGLVMPKSLDLKGILSIVLQVLGLTYANLRGKLVAVLGEKTVGYIETAVSFVKTLVTEGLAGAWKMIVEWVGNLQEMVLGAIQDWVITSVVKAAVMKLVTMFNPVGAIIQGIITIYNTITFFIERAQQIGAVVGSIFDSIGRIAAGDISGAAKFVEQTMAKTLPVVISFLASLLGLGGIGNTIRGIIQKIQSPINKALEKAVGWIVSKAKSVIDKLKGGAETPEQKAKVDAGLLQIDTEESKHAPNGKLSHDEAEKVASTVKSANPIFSSIKVVDGGTHWNYDYAVQRAIRAGTKPKTDEEKEQAKKALKQYIKDNMEWVKPGSGGWSAGKPAEGDRHSTRHEVYKANELGVASGCHHCGRYAGWESPYCKAGGRVRQCNWTPDHSPPSELVEEAQTNKALQEILDELKVPWDWSKQRILAHCGKCYTTQGPIVGKMVNDAKKLRD